MKANTIITIGFISLWCVISVYAQTTPTVPPQVLTTLQNLQADMKQMKSSGKFDNQKTITDLQALMAAAQSNLQNAPQAIKDKITPINASIDKAKTSGADEKQMKEIVHTVIHFIEDQFPGAKMDDKANNTTKATTKTN